MFLFPRTIRGPWRPSPPPMRARYRGPAGGAICRAVPWLLCACALLACTQIPLSVEVATARGGFEVQANHPLEEVRLRDEAGRLLLRHRPAAPTETVYLAHGWEPGTRYHLEAVSAKAEATASLLTPALTGPVEVRLEAPLGQQDRLVPAGGHLDIPVVEGASIRIGILLTPREPCRVSVRLGSQERQLPLVTPGATQQVVLPLEPPFPERIPAVIAVDGEVTRFTLVPRVVTAAEAAARLELVETVFPADRWGVRQAARAPGRVTLPSPWWRGVLARTGLGIRPRNDQVPWAWEGVTLANHGERDLDLLVRSRILDPQGEPAHAFRPRLREADGGVGAVTVLLRVPAGEAVTAALPLFVEDAALPPGGGRWIRELSVFPLGADGALLTDRTPLFVDRGSTWAALGVGLILLASAAGLGLVGFRLGPWLRQARTSDLTTIALFGSVTFVISVASQVFGMAISTALGPFSPLFTGLVDDAFRVALLATLLTLLPRPGVLTLTLVVTTLMRSLALGSFHPLDLLTLGSSVCFLEGFTWLAGLTRGGAWRDASARARWLRLAVGFTPPTFLSTVTALAVGALFYRLYYAGWYVVLMGLLPGFLYVLLACGVATGFADSLRRVER